MKNNFISICCLLLLSSAVYSQRYNRAYLNQNNTMNCNNLGAMLSELTQGEGPVYDVTCGSCVVVGKYTGTADANAVDLTNLSSTSDITNRFKAYNSSGNLPPFSPAGLGFTCLVCSNGPVSSDTDFDASVGLPKSGGSFSISLNFTDQCPGGAGHQSFFTFLGK